MRLFSKSYTKKSGESGAADPFQDDVPVIQQIMERLPKPEQEAPATARDVQSLVRAARLVI